MRRGIYSIRISTGMMSVGFVWNPTPRWCCPPVDIPFASDVFMTGMSTFHPDVEFELGCLSISFTGFR